MSGQQHTPGLLKIDGSGTAFYSANTALTFQPMIGAACGADLSLMQNSANANRLVACWNACEGMSDAEVSRGLISTNHYSTVVNQRDELLEALEFVIRGVPDTWEGVKKARATIAKVKGGAA